MAFPDGGYHPRDDDPWDEHQWEQFMRENDRRVDAYMALLHGFLRSHPRPSGDDPVALARWKEALRGFVERKGWTRDDLVLPFLWLDDAPPRSDHPDEADDTTEAATGDSFLAFDLPDEAFEEGFGDDALIDPLDDFESLPLWQQAYALSTAVLHWADAVPGTAKDDTLVEFCTLVTRIPANVAKGHGLGYERDTLGGNIACVKRALRSANGALALMPSLRDVGMLTGPRYRRLYEDLYECRNALGVYVQELRHRFDLGID